MFVHREGDNPNSMDGVNDLRDHNSFINYPVSGQRNHHPFPPCCPSCIAFSQSGMADLHTLTAVSSNFLPSGHLFRSRALVQSSTS